jgi:hypothetical protein
MVYLHDGNLKKCQLIVVHFRPFSNIDEDLEDIECDNPDLMVGLHGDLGDLKQEVLSAYQQVTIY